MANYVRNYVYCCKELYNDFLYEDYDKRLFKVGMYDPEGYLINSKKHLIIFETYGMEYCTKDIIPIIQKYRDTIWYCVEENEVKEGCFWYNNGKVRLKIRKIIKTLDNSFMEIIYYNKNWITFKKIFINDEKIVIENLVKNTSVCHAFSGEEGTKLYISIKEIREAFQRGRSDDFVQFALPENQPIWYTIRLYDKYDYWSMVELETYEDDYISNYLKHMDIDTEEGAAIAEDIMTHLENIMTNYNIPIKIKYDNLLELIRNEE